MTYSDALSYISSRLRFGIKPGLSRTAQLLEKLGNPHKNLEFIHVAGTNGKGSVCAMVSAALTESGKKTGLYTSPYISDFRERMQIDSCMIEKDELANIIETVRPYADTIDDLTEFELITCAAMLWFSRKQCDIVVLETGLGGRFDSTNIIESPICSVITRIGLDHTAILGDTIEQIAFEKAGIIKPGCSVVSAIQRQEALEVIQKAAIERSCPLTEAGVCAAQKRSIDGTDALYGDLLLHIPFAGDHQLENAAAAVEALRIAGLCDSEISAGIAKAAIPARFEYIKGTPDIIIDGAHNPDGARTLADALRSLAGNRRIIAVAGILEDKDYGEMIKILAPCFDTVITADSFSPRELTSERLAHDMSRYTHAEPGGDFKSALKTALALARDDDIVVICGSLYLAGALRPLCINQF